MSIRLPLKVILSSDNNGEVGAGSVGGGINLPFVIPQDTGNITVKLQASTVGGAVSAQLETTDDGGATWLAVGRTSIVSNANGVTAQWLSVPVEGFGVRTSGVNASVVAVGSVVTIGSIGGTIGNASPSLLAQGAYTGLPILSQQARVTIRITGDLTASSVLLTEVKVNSQSATA